MSILESELRQVRNEIALLEAEIELDPIEQDLMRTFGAQLMSATANVHAATCKRADPSVNPELQRLERDVASAKVAVEISEQRISGYLALRQSECDQLLAAEA